MPSIKPLEAGDVFVAKLNVKNSADVCIQPVIDQADAFLKGQMGNGVPGINYIGPSGNYTLTAAQLNHGVSLKNALDEYNNNLGCS